MKYVFALKKRSILIVLTILLSTVVQDLTLARGRSKIYWTEGSEIKRANLDGTAIENVVTNLYIPKDITLDLRNGKIYWIDIGTTKIENTNIATTKIQRANFDGSNIEDIITGFTQPSKDHEPVEIDPELLRIKPVCIAVDSIAKKIYWGNRYPPYIQRANFDGSEMERVVPDREVAGIMDIKLDMKMGKMYWFDIATRVIKSANLDGTDIEEIIKATDGPTLARYRFDVDRHTRQIYWSDTHEGIIKRVFFNGHNVEDVVTELRSPAEVVLDTHSEKIYWSSRDWKTDTSKIQRANLDGTNVTDILIDLYDIGGIALDTEGVHDVAPDKNRLTTTWANVKAQ